MFEFKMENGFDDPDKIIKEMSRESLIKLDNILIELQRSIAAVTPVGASGDMRSSLGTRIVRKLGVFIGEVFFGKKYAIVVNDGRKEAPVSKTGQIGLSRWIEKSSKGRDFFAGLKDDYPNITLRQATFLLARSLKKKKRDGQKFVEEGVENAAPDVNRIISDLGDKLIKVLAQ